MYRNETSNAGTNKDEQMERVKEEKLLAKFPKLF